jgi:sulfur-oxidizing protein SoxX
MKRLAFLAALLLPLNAAAADPVKGREIVLGRGDANCQLCHSVPGSDRPSGNIGPPLAGTGSRFSEKELRQRIADASRFNPTTIMPPYGKVDGLHGVVAQYRGKPLLTEQEIDDAVAFLLTLK